MLKVYKKLDREYFDVKIIQKVTISKDSNVNVENAGFREKRIFTVGFRFHNFNWFSLSAVVFTHNNTFIIVRGASQHITI